MERELKPKNVVADARKSEQQPKEYTSEELKEICDKLANDNRSMYMQMQHMNQILMSKRIDYLLKIIELSDRIGDAEFVCKCITELKEAMTIPESPKDDESEEEEA